MAQNNLILHMVKREVMKAHTNTHSQKSLPGRTKNYLDRLSNLLGVISN